MNIAGQPSGTALLEFAQTSDGSGGNQHLLLLLPQEKCVEESTRRSYLWAVREKKSKEKQSEEQERPGLICECSSALSACWTKAAGEFDWRIRLVAFLWLLTSGGFGLRLESQWSNRHVCHFMEQSIDCGWGNNAFCFLFLLEERAVHVVVDHLALVAVVWCSLLLPSFFGSSAEECTWGFTWAHGRKLACYFYFIFFFISLVCL